MQLVHGVINSDDDLVRPPSSALEVAEGYEGGRHRFDGAVALNRTGAFGYTVRVVPKNDLLASPAELGVVALPA